MAQKRNSRAGRRRGGILGVLAFAALLALAYFAEPLGLSELLDPKLGGGAGPVPAIADLPEEGLAVSYIDVGQGDSTLIVCNGEAMLIDAGVPEEGQTVVDYLTASGVDSLVYAAVTHAHDDHCGGMDDVVDAFPIGTLFAPYTEFDSSGAFTYFEDAAAERGLYITVPTIGSTFTLGGATVSFVGPVGDWGDDLNDSSLIIRVDYGSRSFLFPGDASDGTIADCAYVGGYGLDSQRDILYRAFLPDQHTLLFQYAAIFARHAAVGGIITGEQIDRYAGRDIRRIFLRLIDAVRLTDGLIIHLAVFKIRTDVVIGDRITRQ